MAQGLNIGRFHFRLREVLQRLWVRVTSFAVLGLLTAVTGFLLRNQIPNGLAGMIGADAIAPILDIIASSMLTVTTFSLSILTAAYATASSGTTPRAVQLLVKDGVSQTVLATFIGAFIFSLVGLIMLNTGLYGDGGRIVLFGVTLAVILIVVVSLLRWINRLGELGLVGDTLSRVEQSTDKALANRLAAPWLGANPLRGAAPLDSVAHHAPQVGYVQNCDMQALSELADRHDLILYLSATPGDFVHLGSPLFHVQNLPDDDEKAQALCRRLTACITLRPARSFEQDPRFGFSVLSEIGQRALSSAVNDPGTAVSVVGRMLRILSQWDYEAVPEVCYPRLYVPAITAQEILRDNLLPLARDGSQIFALQVTLQEAMMALVRLSPPIFGTAAASLARDFVNYASQGLVLESEISKIAAMADNVARMVPSSCANPAT
nr:DUF2254 domain-containing protein [Paracoccus saliphilus]